MPVDLELSKVNNTSKGKILKNKKVEKYVFGTYLTSFRENLNLPISLYRVDSGP